MYRTIVKNLHHIKVLKNKKRAKESRKGSLKASEEKCIWTQKCSWRMTTSSEAESHQKRIVQKRPYQKLIITTSWRFKDQHFKSCLLDSKTLQKTSGNFATVILLKIWRHWMLIFKSVDIVPCTNCTTTLSTTLFLCPRYKTRKQLHNTVSPAKMFLWIRNGFQICSS